MMSFRVLMLGMVGGCGLFAFLSYQQAQDVGRPFLEPPQTNSLIGNDRFESQWLTKMPELTKGLQFMEQRLLYLEVQIQELGRSHSTSSGLLLRPAPRLLTATGSSSEATMSSYKISPTGFASASTLSET